MRLKRLMMAFFATALLATGLAGPAAAQQTGDGLVNVQVNNVDILTNANIGVVAEVVAQICGVRVSNIAVLAEQVDRSGGERTACESDLGTVVISND